MTENISPAGSDHWSVLCEVAGRLSARNVGLAQSLDSLVQTAIGLSEASRGAIQLAPRGDEAPILHAFDEDGARLEDPTHLCQSLLREVLGTSEWVEAEESELENLCSRVGSARAVLGIPLTFSLRDQLEPSNELRRFLLPEQGAMVGALALEFDLDSPDEDVRAPLRLLAEFATSSIQMCRLYERAVLDPLTALITPREFQTLLDEELKIFRAQHIPLSLLVVDIDGFRAIGAEYGWEAGDETLVGVARVLLETTRGIDLCARLGGDEFGVLMPATDSKGVVAIAERVAESVSAVSHGAQDIRVSVSVGAATCPDHAETGEDLLRAARGALAQARARGRGQWVLADRTTGETPGSREDSIEAILSGDPVGERERVHWLLAATEAVAARDLRGALACVVAAAGARLAVLWVGATVSSLELSETCDAAGSPLEEGEIPRLAHDLCQKAFDGGSPQGSVAGSDGCVVLPVGGPGGVVGIVQLTRTPRAEAVSSDLSYLQVLVRLLPPLFGIEQPVVIDGGTQGTTGGDAVSPASVRPTPSRRSGRSRLRHEYEEIIGESPAMIAVLEILDKIVLSEVPILIQGESGTGKELVARAIHHLGPRKNEAFVSENCAAVTETLLESELFGYMKGAFTGAAQNKKGLFEVADGGTLFLDEVGDMSVGMQKKLLRALQEGEIRPVGGKKVQHVNVRIVSATNRNLKQAMKEGVFREDLYYRLNVVDVILPPLREREGDIPLLLDFFLAKTLVEMGMPSKTLSEEAREALLAHSWPGNIREMENEVKRIVALGDDVVELDILSPQIVENYRQSL